MNVDQIHQHGNGKELAAANYGAQVSMAKVSTIYYHFLSGQYFSKRFDSFRLS